MQDLTERLRAAVAVHDERCEPTCDKPHEWRFMATRVEARALLERPAEGWISPSEVERARSETLAACLTVVRRWEAAYPEAIFRPGSQTPDALAAGHGRTVARGIASDMQAMGPASEVLETGHTFRSPGRDSWPAALADLRAKFEAGVVPRGAREEPSLFDNQEPCRVCRL